MTVMPDSAIVHAFSHELTGPLSHSEFTHLYEANARPILNYILAITGRRDVAEDLVQETFCRVLAEKHAVRLTNMDANGARRYLFRVATNLIRDRWRSRNDLSASTSDDFSVETSSEVDLDTCLDVRAILAQLKPRQRELLWLAYVEGMDHAEIAESTGLARLSVRILLFRARNEARNRLNGSTPRVEGQRNE